jgi:hypothetical protein
VKYMKALLAGFLFFVSAQVFADPAVQVWGRSYDYSCGYFSRRSVDLSFTFKDPDVEFGTRVNAIVGFKGMLMLGGPNSRPLVWEDRRVVAAQAIDSSTWEARLIDQTLHSRSSGKFLEKAQFVFEVIHPDGRTEYRNGGSTWGYFETADLNAMVQCVSNAVLPQWRKLDIGVVVKH